MQRKGIPETGRSVRGIRGLVLLAALCLLSPWLWAGGNRETVTQATEGNEVWQTNFDVTRNEPGTYNFIVEARDAAGNQAYSGPFDIKIDPAAGLPGTRVVYPEAGAIIRRDFNLIGVASGRFGVNRVVVQLDEREPQTAEGAEYWGQSIKIGSLTEGPHSIRVQAFDSKNFAGPETYISFTVDRSGPSIEISSHQTGDIISDTVKVSGTLDDVNGVASAAYSLDGGETFRSLGFKVPRGRTAGDFSFSIKTKGLEDGPLVCYIKAVDSTGMETVKPCLLFVDNEGPQVAILSPRGEDDVYGFVQVSGRVYDRVGLSRLYYEWGGAATDIPLRPGDQYWTVPLDFSTAAGNTGAFKITAIDRSGNVSAASVRLQDRRKVKTPVLVIDYPPQAILNALPPDGAVYGHITPGLDAEAVIIEGFAEEIPARPAFRIPPELIPNGRVSLKLRPRASGAAAPGPAVQVRINKPLPAPVPVDAEGAEVAAPAGPGNPSQINISRPGPAAWVAGSSFVLEGAAPGAGRVEYRLHPGEDWRSLSASGASFRAEVAVADVAEGPIHLELRSYTGGSPNLPLYYPLSRIAAAPAIEIFSPSAELGPVHGNVTVSGVVNFSAPLREAAFSLDNSTYTPVEYKFRNGRAWFSFSADFSALNRSRGRLSIRAVDVSGASAVASPEAGFDNSTDIPVLIVNTPGDGELVTGDFDVSGVAFDDDAVAAVSWRLLRPGSSRSGAGGFTRIDTSRSFQVAVPFSAAVDGENIIEIYAEDIYGVRSETATRTIKVSTAPPENRVVSPGIAAYSRRQITVRGTASDANGIATVELSMDNGNTWQAARGAESWTLDLNTAAYQDGVYSLLVRTADNFGVSAISNALINIDNTSPNLSISLPKNDSRAGGILEIAGRMWDNIELRAAVLQLLGASSPNSKISVDLPLDEVILQTLDVSRLPQGEYILRISAEDRAGNSMTASRKITLARSTSASEVALYNPMPGLDYSGPLIVSGKVSGADIPKTISLFVNGGAFTSMEVDQYGYFRHQHPEEQLTQNAALVFSAGFDSPSGAKIVSKEHPVNFVKDGPALAVDSHRDGDVITGRPWLSGRAWTAMDSEAEAALTRAQRRDLAVREVLVSFDNGRSFERAAGRETWKFRLEAGSLPLGNLPVVIRANFQDGRSAVRRLALIVDVNAPVVETLDPIEDSTHRDNIQVFGAASDDMTLDAVEVSLRSGSKLGYSTPQFIQGLYLDTNFLGATVVDAGLGLSFFKDNVKLQVQVGNAPLVDPVTEERGRFVGLTAGVKLLANVFYLPFDYFLGPDWSFFSMSFALGANFSWFAMEPPKRPSMIMGAVLGQWEFARADLSYFFPKWKYARTFALYLEPIWWIASSDVMAEAIFRCGIGFRVNMF